MFEMQKNTATHR